MLLREAPHHAEGVETLFDEAFGHNRNGRAVYALRQGREPVAELSWLYECEDRRVQAAIRYWAVHINQEPALLLGPIAASPEWQNKRLGSRLIRHTLHLAETLPFNAVVLVGPINYYRRFGFQRAPHLQIDHLEVGKTILALPLRKDLDVLQWHGSVVV